MPIIPPEPPPQPPQPPKGPLTDVPLNDSLAQQIAANDAKAAQAAGGKSGPVNVPKPDTNTPLNMAPGRRGQPRLEAAMNAAAEARVDAARRAAAAAAAALPSNNPPQPPPTPPSTPPPLAVDVGAIVLAGLRGAAGGALVIAGVNDAIKIAKGEGPSLGLVGQILQARQAAPVGAVLPFGVGIARALAMLEPSVMIPSPPMHTDC